MSYGYYPAGMSYEDLVYVGEIDDPNAPRPWFEDAVNDEGADRIYDLWEEFCTACDDDLYAFNEYGAAQYMQEFYPEFWTYYEPMEKTA